MDCTMSRCVWALCDEQIVEHISMINEEDAKLWIFEVMNSVSQNEFISVLVTMWAIWFARRKVIFDDEYQSLLSTYCFIKNFMDDLEKVKQEKPVLREPIRPAGPRWIAPPMTMAKVNVDAAVAKTSCRGAVAAVARDEKGEFLGCSVLTVEGLTDPTTLESMACREGIALAADLNLQRVKLSTDCLQVANSLCSSIDRGRYGAVIRECQEWSKQFEAMIFGHEGRTSNGEAHSLARTGTSMDVGRSVCCLRHRQTCVFRCF